MDKSIINAESARNLSIWIHNVNSKTKLEAGNILYCKSSNSSSKFHLAKPVNGQDAFVSSRNIKFWEKYFIDSVIVRVHNQFLVNLKYVVAYKPRKAGGAFLVLKSGEEIPVSKSRRTNVKQVLALCITAT